MSEIEPKTQHIPFWIPRPSLDESDRLGRLALALWIANAIVLVLIAGYPIGAFLYAVSR